MTPTTDGVAPAEEFRRFIGRFATGVTVVTTVADGVSYATTASALTSVSLDPPTLLICMNRESHTGQAIARSRRFAVNVLGEHQASVARHFARKGTDLSGHVVVRGQRGLPVFADNLATFECRVVEAVDAATHTVFIAVVETAAGHDGMPLAYFGGRFGRLQLDEAS